ncbi:MULTISPECIES: hypothetical protein [Dyadobacter]|uniref:Uncharacterized protein n=1 Tax=Dyadobacter psychrotolerans TaxID=2541721 RepID=A0A4R5DGT0_9BACT|nr:hypothetical protein [Dyadobacter psychrotolerans]TDE13242.1 hypothetical protein E0F88_19520 [Dyadobacter psychrotolerans]
MKALALILCLRLLLVNFLPNQDMHELSGIADLIEHYQEHEHEHADHDDDLDDNDHHNISFLEFLSMHYADEHHKNSAGHENLPFHHSHPSTAVNYFFTPIYSLVFQPVHYAAIERPKFSFISRLISSFSYSIWQPPKF